jgi:hypothetical protein
VLVPVPLLVPVQVSLLVLLALLERLLEAVFEVLLLSVGVEVPLALLVRSEEWEEMLLEAEPLPVMLGCCRLG